MRGRLPDRGDCSGYKRSAIEGLKDERKLACRERATNSQYSQSTWDEVASSGYQKLKMSTL